MRTMSKGSGMTGARQEYDMDQKCVESGPSFDLAYVRIRNRLYRVRTRRAPRWPGSLTANRCPLPA